MDMSTNPDSPSSGGGNGSGMGSSSGGASPSVGSMMPQSPSRYEVQKRRDWNTFGQYLRNHRPPLSLSQCSGAHVLEFLRYLDQFGKTKVHAAGCPFFGHPNPPATCPCPRRQAWGSLDALVGRLRAAFEENGGRPESNPFAARAVRLFLREVREHQARARGVSYEKKKSKKPQQLQIDGGSGLHGNHHHQQPPPPPPAAACHHHPPRAAAICHSLPSLLWTMPPRSPDQQQGLGDDLSKLLQEWVGEGFRHECEQQIVYSNIYGREDIQEGITKQLLSNDDNNRRSTVVICLAAKRGLGKTTLVRSVYNDQRVSDAFDLRLWISMPEMLDEKVIMTSIVEHATQVQCDVMELKLLRQLAKDELSERKFLIVLEDCHIEHHHFWKIIHGIMGFGGKTSAIIITTNNEDVRYPTCIPLHIYKLSPLRDEHCLQILQQFTCGDNHGPGRNHRRTRINSQIIYSCGGNPVYLKAICGLLCHAGSALQQLNNLDGELFPDLKLCYDLLPQHLKLCLSFCSLFPKDYMFTRHHLIKLWMSLGFVNLEEGSPEEVSTRCFKELLCRSFFEQSSSHENKEDSFVMPKSLHDMVTSISKDVCLRSNDLICGIPEKIRHLSLVPLDRRTVVVLHPVTKQVGSLDAFLVVNRLELQNNSMSLPFLNLEGLDDFLLKFKSLRTLNLSYTVIGDLPASIGNLKNLQYLAVNNTDIRRLPPELCLLRNLLTLEVRNCPQLVTLPNDTANLATLRHLDLRKQTGHVRMPFAVGELIHLQTLPIFNVGGGFSDCSITELSHLDNLHGDLTITGLENVKAGSDAREAKLINKKYLETLTLQWNGDDIYFELEDEESSADVIEGLQPPSDLENLTVRNYSGSLFPAWIEKSPYESLLSVTLDSCYNCCVLPALGDLQSLKYLCLRKMYALKTFGYISLSEERNGGKFPALELLKLWEMYELEEWVGVKDGDFPRLHNVSVCGCPVLKSLPCFPSLVDLSLHRCNQLPGIPELVRLKSLKIEGFQDTVSLDLPQGLPALKNLEIIRCNKLASLAGLSTLSSVERLKIVKCPNLDLVNNWQQYHFKTITRSRDATVILI